MTAAGVIVLRESPRPLQLLAIPLALFGLALIVGLDWASLPPDYRLGVIFGLLTAASYAGYLLSLRKSRQGSTHRLPTREVAIVSLVTAAILGVSAMVEGESLAITTLDRCRWLVVLRHPVALLRLDVHRQQPAARLDDRGRTRAAAAADAELRLGRAVLRAADERQRTGRCRDRACSRSTSALARPQSRRRAPGNSPNSKRCCSGCTSPSRCDASGSATITMRAV